MVNEGQATLLAVTENGYGNAEIGEYRVSYRGGKGHHTIKTTTNGNMSRP